MALYLLYGIVSITRRFKLTELLVFFFLADTPMTFQLSRIIDLQFISILGLRSWRFCWAILRARGGGGGGTPLDYTGRLRPKEVPFSGWRYMKG